MSDEGFDLEFSPEEVTEDQARTLRLNVYIYQNGTCGFANAGKAMYIKNNNNYNVIATVRVKQNPGGSWDTDHRVPGNGGTKFLGCTIGGGSTSPYYTFNLINVRPA